MTPTKKETPSLDQHDPQVRRRNEQFEQEAADSRDHTKQSGRGEGDNTLAKPAGKSDKKS